MYHTTPLCDWSTPAHTSSAADKTPDLYRLLITLPSPSLVFQLPVDDDPSLPTQTLFSTSDAEIGRLIRTNVSEPLEVSKCPQDRPIRGGPPII
jgi:hypothetical protein